MIAGDFLIELKCIYHNIENVFKICPLTFGLVLFFFSDVPNEDSCFHVNDKLSSLIHQLELHHIFHNI